MHRLSLSNNISRIKALLSHRAWRALPLIVSALLSYPLSAQTCRVAAGVNAQGTRCYMEVFEYDYVTKKPSFPGGDSKLVEFINHNRVYPDKAYREGVQGKVTCSFVVHPNGSISHIKVLKGVEESLNQEAVRILGMMPQWTPGNIDGQSVPVRVIWTIPFRK